VRLELHKLLKNLFVLVRPLAVPGREDALRDGPHEALLPRLDGRVLEHDADARAALQCRVEEGRRLKEVRDAEFDFRRKLETLGHDDSHDALFLALLHLDAFAAVGTHGGRKPEVVRARARAALEHL